MKAIIVLGLPGSGKSFLASRLAEKISAVYVSSDQIRNNQIPHKTYSKMEKEVVYKSMLNILHELIEQNKSIVLDGTFYKNDLRELFLKKCREFKIPNYIIEVIAKPSLIQKRLSHTRPDSDADIRVYQKIKMQFEAIKEDHLELESKENNIEDMLNQCISYIAREKK